MTPDAITFLGGLFDDIGVRAPIGVTWVADSRLQPLGVTVTAADHPGRSFRLPDTDLDEAGVRLAAEVQGWLIPLLGAAVPPCPSDGLALLPQRSESGPRWVCPGADFACGFGEYLLALWPPADGEPEVTMMLAARLKHRGVRFAGVGMTRRSGSLTAEIVLHDGEDEAVAQAAVAPYAAEVSWADPVTTERFLESTGEGTYRGLRLCGGGPHRLALTVGPLRRAAEADDCDVLVGGNRVRLGPAHRIGAPGEVLIIDVDGVPFADEGEVASCGGGSVGSSVRGEPGVFFGCGAAHDELAVHGASSGRAAAMLMVPLAARTFCSRVEKTWFTVAAVPVTLTLCVPEGETASPRRPSLVARVRSSVFVAPKRCRNWFGLSHWW